MNIDIIEMLCQKLGNSDIVNMSLMNRETSDMMKDVVEKRRLKNFMENTGPAMEAALRLLNGMRMFVNKEIADMMYESEYKWMHTDIMNNILEKMRKYLNGYKTVMLSYDCMDPTLYVETKMGEYSIHATLNAGISCSSSRPVYNWHGVSIRTIDIYQNKGAFLMSWRKKYDEQTTLINYTRDGERFIERHHTHNVYDTFVRFDSFKSTPNIAHKYPNNVAKRGYEYNEDNSDDNSDDDCEYDEDYDYDSDHLFPEDMYDHLTSDEVDYGMYRPYAEEIKRIMNVVFFKPRNIIEEILFKADEVVSKFLYRYQTWSTCENEEYIHAQEEPQWFDAPHDEFVDELKAQTRTLFADWTYEDISDDFITMWMFTTKDEYTTQLTFHVGDCSTFEWTLKMGKYDIHINAMTREYCFSIDSDEDLDDPDFDGTDVSDVQFYQKKMNVVFDDIGFKHNPGMKVRHFTKEEINNILS
ncbi:hypothetical protein ATCVCanal1_912L [Acanthocystis turfacea Chlorella virus Canal-1]|nr:hypothetical protein ATCVCanal1_912L [Acanthocystis turfacea Chlorella virus Canal-1]